MKVTIDLELPEKIAAEFEAIAYRFPRTGETCLRTDGNGVFVAVVDYGLDHHIILLKKWQWPAGFDGVAAMARDRRGSLFAYEAIPVLSENCFAATRGNICVHAEWMFPSLDFPRPDRWQDSLRINPNFKQ